MADLNFPKDRTELDPPGTGPLQTGDTYTDAGTTWVYNADAGVWGSGQGSVTNETYLRLDASNDPVTGNCEFADGVSVTGGFIVQGTTTSAAAAGSGVFAGGYVRQFCNQSDYPEGNKSEPQPFQVVSAPTAASSKEVVLSLNASGSAYFKGLTEHAGGVKVTGGVYGAVGTTPDQLHVGLSSSDGQLYVMSVGDPNDIKPISFQVGGKTQCSVNNLGRFASSWSYKTPTATLMGFETRGLTDGAADSPVTKIMSYRADGGIANNFADTGVPRSNIDGYGFFAANTYGRSNGEAGTQRQANRLKTYAGFATDSLTNCADTTYGFHTNIGTSGSSTQYAFYAAGNAPNYFAGTVRIGLNEDPLPADSDGIQLAAGGMRVGRNNGSANNSCAVFNRSGSTTGKILDFKAGNAPIDSIRLDGSGGITYGTSDYRAKENIVDLPSTVDQIKALRPVNFNFTWAPGKTRPGFIAHEVAEALPAAVVGEKDEVEAIGTLTDWDGTELETDVTEPEELTYTEEVDTDGVATMVTRTRSWSATGTRDVYQGVDQTKLIPLLTKALQEALSRLEAIEANEVVDDATDSALLTLVANLATRVSALENA